MLPRRYYMKEGIGLTLSNFTMTGYAHFYRSILRFGRGIDSEEAAELTYLLYTAVLDSYRNKKPGARIEECGPEEFYGNLAKTERRPYRTIVQFYRAAEAVALALVPLSDALNLAQINAFLRLNGMLDNVEMRFDMAFNMDIDDPRTVYGECVSRLAPRRDEPGLCLMEDWINLPTA